MQRSEKSLFSLHKIINWQSEEKHCHKGKEKQANGASYNERGQTIEY